MAIVPPSARAPYREPFGANNDSLHDKGLAIPPHEHWKTSAHLLVREVRVEADMAGRQVHKALQEDRPKEPTLEL